MAEDAASPAIREITRSPAPAAPMNRDRVAMTVVAATVADIREVAVAVPLIRTADAVCTPVLRAVPARSASDR